MILTNFDIHILYNMYSDKISQTFEILPFLNIILIITLVHNFKNRTKDQGLNKLHNSLIMVNNAMLNDE